MNIELLETFTKLPAQQQSPPGEQEKMVPKPIEEDMEYVATGKLTGKVAIITGGDSGIGRSVAIQFAKEGTDICIVCLSEEDDAELTAARIEELGRRAIQFEGDIADPEFCGEVVKGTLNAFGRIDILINNAGEQHEVNGVEDLAPDGVERIFRTNIFGFFYLTRATLPHLNFTRSLAKELAEKKIRVNAVAPGPIWTPLIPTTFKPGELKTFAEKTLFKRPGQPVEVAPAYLFLATETDSSFMTGQVVHVNGGQGMVS